MPEKTDIWMPLYIGDYLAATSHLSAEESGAYLHLLMHQWKNGSLPPEPELLRRIAKVERDAWSIAWAVLKPFFDDATGVPVQKKLETIRVEWQQKKFRAKAKATAAADKRWGKNAWSIPPSNAPSTVQAMLEPCPSSSPSSLDTKNKQKTSRDKREADPRFAEFVEDLASYWRNANGALPFGFGPSEGSHLKKLVATKMNRATFQRCLDHRLRSEDVNHCEPVHKWLSKVTAYANGPLNKYNRPIGAETHGSSQQRSSQNAAAERQRISRDAIGEAVASRIGHSPRNTDGPDAELFPQSDVAAGDAGSLAAGMGGIGSKVRTGHFHGRIVEGRQ